MIRITLIVVGIVLLLIGWLYFYLNNNSPIQTRVPAYCLPAGAVCLLLGIGSLL